MESGREVTMRAHPLTLWAAARERAVDELSSRAARLAGQGQKDVAGSSHPGAGPGSRVLGRCGHPSLRTMPHLNPMNLKLDQCLYKPASGRVSRVVLYWTRVDVPVSVVPRHDRAAADLASAGAQAQ